MSTRIVRDISGLVFVLAIAVTSYATPAASLYCFAPLGYTVSSGISHIDCIDTSDSIAQGNCPSACSTACSTNWSGNLYRANNCQFDEGDQQWETGAQECYCNDPAFSPQ